MLRQLFNKHKCDKGHRHGYESVYEPDFEKVREEPINILEVGILRGESIKAWVEYFPNATIYGIDNFSRVSANTISILDHERVKWLSADSMSPGLKDHIKENWGSVKFDFIIDDGLHTPKANAATFSNLYPLLKKGGIFYIEDVFPIDKLTIQEMNLPFFANKGDTFSMIEYNKFLNIVNPYKPEQIDLRKNTGNLDSYIFKVTK